MSKHQILTLIVPKTDIQEATTRFGSDEISIYFTNYLRIFAAVRLAGRPAGCGEPRPAPSTE